MLRVHWDFILPDACIISLQIKDFMIQITQSNANVS